MKDFFLRHKLLFLLFAAVLCVQIFIFANSMQDGPTSSAASGAVVEIIGPVVEDILSVIGIEPTQDNVVRFVRKAGHFLEFALLGVVVFAAMGMLLHRPVRRLPAAFALCVVTAVVDEWIQSFSPGRSPQITDVMIDSAGALAGILATWLCAICIGLAAKKRRAASNTL